MAVPPVAAQRGEEPGQLGPGWIPDHFCIGTVAYVLHISDDGGLGEILIMIAVMMAFQAQLIWRRAQALPAASARGDRLDAPYRDGDLVK